MLLLLRLIFLKEIIAETKNFGRAAVSYSLLSVTEVFIGLLNAASGAELWEHYTNTLVAATKTTKQFIRFMLLACCESITSQSLCRMTNPPLLSRGLSRQLEVSSREPSCPVHEIRNNVKNK